MNWFRVPRPLCVSDSQPVVHVIASRSQDWSEHEISVDSSPTIIYQDVSSESQSATSTIKALLELQQTTGGKLWSHFRHSPREKCIKTILCALLVWLIDAISWGRPCRLALIQHISLLCCILFKINCPLFVPFVFVGAVKEKLESKPRQPTIDLSQMAVPIQMTQEKRHSPESPSIAVVESELVAEYITTGKTSEKHLWIWLGLAEEVLLGLRLYPLQLHF